MNPAYPRHWTRERIIAAIQTWAAEHGRPPKAAEWAHATPWRPARPTCENMFGTWNKTLEAAGFETRPSQGPGPYQPWSRDMIRDAFLDFVCREGRWPTSTDCGQWRHGRSARVEGLPSWQVVYRYFGSFGAAKVYAGWDPGASLRVVRAGCAGCGGELDNTTIGCASCWDRRRQRERRAAVRNGTLLAAVESSSTPMDSGPADGNAARRRPVVVHTEKAA